MSESKSWWEPQVLSNRPQEQTKQNTFQSKPAEPEDGAQDDHPPNRRIHLLGMGSIGTLIAHSLRTIPNPPPIVLMMHRPELYDDFSRKYRRVVRLIDTASEISDEQSGYDVDVLETKKSGKPFWKFIPTNSGPGTPPINLWKKDEEMESGELYISSLIVTVKAQATVAALRSVKHRLNATSTICLMQNGLGQVDELNREVFTNPSTRPTYLLGIISHGCYMSQPFSVVHAGMGTTALGIYRDENKYPMPPERSSPILADISEEDRKRMYPTDEELYSNLSARYLLRTLTRIPVLACAAYPYLDLLQLQLEKLSVNALLNPMTALLDFQNGFMQQNPHYLAVHRLLLAEISLVIRNLPELARLPNVEHRFSAERLETNFMTVAKKTAKNSSSMREDMRRGSQTEIDYINGYITKRGEQLGIKCVLNYMMIQLVKGKLETLNYIKRAPDPYS